MTGQPTASSGRVRIERLTTPQPLDQQVLQDLAAGWARAPRSLPPKYFYDARGSALFERITELPEYYPTRAETEILERIAGDVVGTVAPVEIAELGSGSSRKTRLLLEAMHRHGTGDRYVPLDVSEQAIRGAADDLTTRYGWLHVQGYVGDFNRDIARLPRDGQRLLAFLGSTIGNRDRAGRHRLLSAVRDSLRHGDRFLLGADLVKDPDELIAAYDDAAGVTAEFNRNMLRVVADLTGTPIEVEAFSHVARWNADEERIEMWLRADEEQVLAFPGGLTVRLERGEELLTELSCKFRVDGLREELASAGLIVERVETDEAGRFSSWCIRSGTS